MESKLHFKTILNCLHELIPVKLTQKKLEKNIIIIITESRFHPYATEVTLNVLVSSKSLFTIIKIALLGVHGQLPFANIRKLTIFPLEHGLN